MFDVEEAAPDDRPGGSHVRAQAGWKVPRRNVGVDDRVDEEPAAEGAADGRVPG
jgi:hypothetical protein